DGRELCALALAAGSRSGGPLRRARGLHVRADRLLVPTAKDLGSPPLPSAPALADHYQCYRVRPSVGSPVLRGLRLTSGRTARPPPGTARRALSGSARTARS